MFHLINPHYLKDNFQSLAPEFPTSITQFICSNVSPYQDILFNNVVGDQGLIPHFSFTSQPLSPFVFVPIVLFSTHVSVISPTLYLIMFKRLTTQITQHFLYQSHIANDTSDGHNMNIGIFQ